MKRPNIVLLLVLLSLVATAVLADAEESADQLLHSFHSTGTDGKVGLLRRLHEDPSKAAVPVYLAALDFAVDNDPDALADPRIYEIGRLAIDSLATLEASDGVEMVFRYFLAQTSDETRILSVRVIRSCAAEISDDKALALGDFLSRRNHMTRAGDRPNLELIGVTIQALSAIRNPNSFRVLFEAATHPNYPTGVRETAAAGLSKLDVDVEAELLALLDSAGLEEYGAVLDFSIRSESLSAETRTAIARSALRYTMDSRYRDLADAESAKDLRHKAAMRLSALSGFSPPKLAVGYFDAVYDEYRRRRTTLSYVIEAIGILGRTGDHVAAVRLNDLLDSLNVEVEFDSPVEDQLVIATIREIDRLGSAIGADTLLQTQLLDFPRDVRRLARDVEIRLRRSGR